MKFKNWKDTLKDYLDNSQEYWGADTRQPGKLERIKKKVILQYKIKEDEFADFAINLSEGRTTDLPKLYISNIGGSGSHWLSTMIQEFPGWFDLGEVYFPIEFYKKISNLTNKEEAVKFYDAVELVHGFLYTLKNSDALSAKIINSAHGVEKIPFHRGLFPNAKIIHLFRDPRDRTLSVTHRKSEYRLYAHSGKTDKEYLVYNSKRVRSGFHRYSNQVSKADLELKYEKVKEETETVLQDISNLLDADIPQSGITAIAKRFNAKNLLESSNSKQKGNLFTNNGELAKGWRGTGSPDELRIMHSVMKPAIIDLKYELCDCFGYSINYKKTIKINRKMIEILLAYGNHIRIFSNGDWTGPNNGNIQVGDIINAIRVDGNGLERKDLIEILNNIEVNVLCINGLSRGEVKAVFSGIKRIKTQYIDASSIEKFPIEVLKRCANLKLINLSGCNIIIPKKYRRIAIVDF